MDRRQFLVGSAGAASALPALPPLPAPGADQEKFWKELRWHFHIPATDTYYNTGTLGACPKTSLAAMHAHGVYVEQRLSSCLYRGNLPIYLGGYQDEPALRARVGRWLNASREEVALTRNATMGQAMVAMGLQLAKGDEVVLTDQEHPGGRCAYDTRVARDGIVIKEVTIPIPCNDPQVVVDGYKKALGPRTRVVSIPHITSAYGMVLPVKEIIAAVRAHDADIFIVVDGAQALGQIPVDVQDLDCDAYYSSPHKWLLAPKGTGILYLRLDRQAEVWTTIASSDWDPSEHAADPGRRLSQMGTGNQSLHKGFEASLDLLERLGPERIHKRIKALGDHLRSELGKLPHIEILSSTHPAMCAGITNFRIKGWAGHPATIHLYEKHKIMPRAAAKGIRVSQHIYTDMAAIDRLCAALKTMAR